MSANPSTSLSIVQKMEHHLANPERRARLLALAERDGAKLERILTVAMKVVAFDTKLQACSIDSIVQAVSDAVEVGLEPSGFNGEAYLIPRKRSFKDPKTGKWDEVIEAHLQLSYKGEAVLASENGWEIHADVIREGDRFLIQRGAKPKLEHEYAPYGQRGEPLYFYAVATQVSTGFTKWECLEKDEVDYIRDTFAGYKGEAPTSGPWVDHYIPMGKKTAIHRVKNLLPLSPKQRKTREIDGAFYDSETVVRGRAVPANPPTGGSPPETPPAGGEAGSHGNASATAPQDPSPAPAPPSRKKTKLSNAQEAAEAKGSACPDCIPESPKNPVGVKCPKHGGAQVKEPPAPKSVPCELTEGCTQPDGHPGASAGRCIPPKAPSEITDIVTRAANSGNPCNKTRGCILADGHPPFCKSKLADTAPTEKPAVKKDEDPGPCSKTEGCRGIDGHGGGCVVPKAAEPATGSGLFGGKAGG